MVINLFQTKLKTMKHYLPLKSFLIISGILGLGLLAENLFSQDHKTKKKEIKVVKVTDDGEIVIDSVFVWESDSIEHIKYLSFDSLGFSIESLLADIDDNIEIDFDFDFDEIVGDIDANIVITNDDSEDVFVKKMRINDGTIIINDDTISYNDENLVEIISDHDFKNGVYVFSDDEDNVVKTKVHIHNNDKNYAYSYSHSHDKSGETYYIRGKNQPVKVLGDNSINRDVYIKDIDESNADDFKEYNLPKDLFSQTLEVDNLQFYSERKKHLSYSFNNPTKEKSLIKLYSISGEIVYEKENSSEKVKDAIDISNFGSGTYFISITQGKKSLSKKLIVN